MLRKPRGNEGRAQGDASKSQETPKTASKPPEAKKRPSTNSPSQPSESRNPADTLTLTSSLQNRDNKFLLFKPPSPYFVTASLTTQYTHSLTCLHHTITSEEKQKRPESHHIYFSSHHIYFSVQQPRPHGGTQSYQLNIVPRCTGTQMFVTLQFTKHFHVPRLLSVP